MNIQAASTLRRAWKNLDGLFDLSARPYQIDGGGFAADARNLGRDFRAVGEELKRKTDREQADQRARKK